MQTAARPLGAVQRVPVDASGRRWAAVRELCGFDEESVGGRSTLDAVRLLDRILVDEPGSGIQPGAAALLTIPERDLLLAAAWRMGWGSRIAGTIDCDSCEKPFDYDFDIDDVADNVRSATDALPNSDGVYKLSDDVEFRLPTAEDERALIGLADEIAERELLLRCLMSGDIDAHRDAVESAMELVGNGMDIDVNARCTECGAEHALRFQIQEFLLGAITSDWHGLVEDVHRIAQAYRWGLNEIMSLARSRRRAFTAILDGDPLSSGSLS